MVIILKLEIIQPYHPTNVRLFGKMYMSSLTPPILAGLNPPDIEVSITDENVEEIDFNKPVDLVCITTLTPSAPRAYEIADEFRARGVKVAMGGVHPTLVPEEAIAHADAIILGEAEGVWQKMLDDFRRGSLQKFYRLEKKPDLTNLSRPRRDLMNEKAYVNVPKVETSRGCPFNCSFCSTTTFFGNNIRYRPIQEVVQEIKDLKGRFVFFTDNNIVGNPKYAKELFKALIPLKIKWISQGSLNLAKDWSLLKLAASSGCVGMLIGFESLVNEAIEAMGKKVNKIIEYAEAIRRIHSQGIGIIGCFVFGFDEEDPGVFKRTVNFIKRLNIEVPQLTVLTPYPGTALREKLEETGRILHNRWEKYDTTHVVFRPKLMSPEEFRAHYDWACQKVYSYWAIFMRMLKSLRHLRSIYKFFVFWQINVVYRRLYQISLEDRHL